MMLLLSVYLLAIGVVECANESSKNASDAGKDVVTMNISMSLRGRVKPGTGLDEQADVKASSSAHFLEKHNEHPGMAEAQDTEFLQTMDVAFNGDFMLENSVAQPSPGAPTFRKYLSADCWLQCGHNTNLMLYGDLKYYWPQNRIFAVESQGSGIHLLRSKRGDLYVAEFTGSVKLASSQHKSMNAARWRIDCSNGCTFQNLASGRCLAAVIDPFYADIVTDSCSKSTAQWTLRRQ